MRTTIPEFIEFDDMPVNLQGLSEIVVDPPRLSPDSEAHCPATRAALIEQLKLDAPDTAVSETDLEFLRTARVGNKSYWIWRFQLQGVPHYGSVCLRNNGDVCFSYARDLGWTPEQYILGEYHDYFFDHWRQIYTVRYPPDHPKIQEMLAAEH